MKRNRVIRSFIQNDHGRQVVLVGSVARQLLSKSLGKRLNFHEVTVPKDAFDKATVVALLEEVESALRGENAGSSSGLVVLAGLLEQAVAVTAHWSSPSRRDQRGVGGTKYFG